MLSCLAPTHRYANREQMNPNPYWKYDTYNLRPPLKCFYQQIFFHFSFLVINSRGTWNLEPFNKIIRKYTTIHKHIACLALCFFQHIKTICHNNMHKHKNNTLMAGLWASKKGLQCLTTETTFGIGPKQKYNSIQVFE